MRIFTVTVCVAVVATCAASADIVLTFDDLGLPDRSEVTDQYAGLGVTFSVPAGGTTRIVTASTPLFPGDPQGLYNDEEVFFGIPFTEPIIADFSIDAISVGAFIDFGDVDHGLKIEAFDGPGGTGNLLGTASTVNETFLGVNAAGIRSVVFSQADGGDRATYLIDHFTFELVPNPGVLAVFGVGALLTNCRRRR